MIKLYKYSVAYFLLFTLLLLLSGIMLFEHKIGFSIKEITSYYFGNIEQFINAKTYSGILKTVLPHILAFALLSMVLLHFLVFTKHRGKTSSIVLIYFIFTSAFFEIFSPFFILLGADVFAYVKIISFIVFELLILYIAWLLFRTVFND